MTSSKRNAAQATDAVWRGRESGFTLLEMLVVVAILGLLLTVVGPAVLRQFGNAKISIARQSIASLSSVLDIYKLDVGTFPSSTQGLVALVERPRDLTLWSGPYLKGGTPQDPWGRPYLYRMPSNRPKFEYDLCSRGPNAEASDTSPDLICNAS